MNQMRMVLDCVACFPKAACSVDGLVYMMYCTASTTLKYFNITSVSLQFVCMESLVTAIIDMYPKVFRKGYRREQLILVIALASYLIGLIMVTEVS